MKKSVGSAKAGFSLLGWDNQRVDSTSLDGAVEVGRVVLSKLLHFSPLSVRQGVGDEIAKQVVRWSMNLGVVIIFGDELGEVLLFVDLGAKIFLLKKLGESGFIVFHVLCLFPVLEHFGRVCDNMYFVGKHINHFLLITVFTWLMVKVLGSMFDLLLLRSLQTCQVLEFVFLGWFFLELWVFL